MSWEIAFVFAVVSVILVLFVWERWPIDQVALAVPVMLLAGGVLTPEEAVSGFSNPATVTVAAMLVLSLGLLKTGAVPALGRWIRGLDLGGDTPRLMLLCGGVGLISPFLNNTAVVAVFLPLFLSLARDAGTTPSRYLIPLSYSAILGGTISLIGTSTNLIVWGMARERGLDELSIFSITPLGLIYLVVGLAYVLTVGRWLLPARAGPVDLSEKYDVRSFVTELRVRDDSDLVGRDLGELEWSEKYEVRVVGVHRGAELIPGMPEGMPLRAGDALLVQGDTEAFLALAEKEGLATAAEDEDEHQHEHGDRDGDDDGIEVEVEDEDGDEDGNGNGDEDRRGDEDGNGSRDFELEGEDVGLVEVLIPPGSPLTGRLLSNLGFSPRLGVTVLALQRSARIRRRLARVRLREGDLLLVHGPLEALSRLAEQSGLLPLGEVETPVVSRPRAFVSVAIMVGVVLAAALDLAPILPAALAGVVLMLFTRCVRLEEMYREMDWMVVFLLAGLIPLGIAMENTGAVAWLVDGVAGVLAPLPLVVVVGGFYLLTSVLTEIMSNNATAVVMTPVALAAAEGLQLSPYALLVAVMFGASASFMTPTGYQTNTMVYGPGGYRYTDFLRVGAPLNVILLVVAAVLIPVFWGG